MIKHLLYKIDIIYTVLLPIAVVIFEVARTSDKGKPMCLQGLFLSLLIISTSRLPCVRDIHCLIAPGTPSMYSKNTPIKHGTH